MRFADCATPKQILIENVEVLTLGVVIAPSRIINHPPFSVPHFLRILSLFIFWLWLTVFSLAAEYTPPAEYTLREWHANDGLPSDEIGSIMQDENGYLWVAATGGLTRFDGTTFDPIRTPPDVAPRSMVYRRTSVQGEATGIIATGSLDFNVEGNLRGKTDGYYARSDGIFQFISEPKLTGKNIRILFVQEDGSTWLACDDGTLLRRHGPDTELFNPPQGLTGKRTPLFATDGAKQLWVSIDTYIARFDGTRWIPLPIDHGEPEIKIASSRTSGPWVFTRTALLKWNGEKLEEIVKLPELLGVHFIQTAIEDQHGSLWIGTRSQGLFRISGREITKIPTSNDDIYSLLEDSNGGIWVGTNGGGLNRLRPKAHRLFDKTSGLKDNFSYTVTEDSNGVIWIANRDGGIARIINDEVDPISRRAAWRPFSAMSVNHATDGGVWITSGIGVFRTAANEPEQLQRIRSLDTFKIVRSTLIAHNGDYWLSLDPDHVARWRDNKITTFGPAEGFEGREVRAIAEDASGTIWIGAADGRLFRNKGDRLERVPLDGDENFGSLQALHFEADGTLLIGSTRKGLLIAPAGNLAHLRIAGSEQGLPSDNISQILPDDFDHYWIGSRNGIFRISRPLLGEFLKNKTKHIHAVMLGKDDGVPDLSCLGLFQPSAWKSRNGILWFATRRGMLRINPALISNDEDSVPVSISSVKYDGQAQPVADEMNVRSTVRKIEICFSALSLAAPERILVRYRLDGFDNDWVIQRTGRVAAYPKLPPGKYIFRVMASNGNGEWSGESALVRLTVTPPWWQSPWAQLLYLLALILVVAVLARLWSHRRLRHRLERLEREKAIERERTRIAQNIHDDLGASLTRISLLTQAAQHKNPAQATTFEEIYDTARVITRSMDEIVWAVNPKWDDMENLVTYVGNFAQSFLATANIRCRLNLPKELPAIPLTSQVRHNLFLCCKEALNNVVKHAHATEVVLTITVTTTSLQISITDNGCGLAAPKTPDLHLSKNPFRSSGGNGLKNMRARMTEMSGECVISAQNDAGTTLTFTLALPASNP